MRRFLLAVMTFWAAEAFAQYEGSITVQRLLLELRVMKHGGDPITDLQPSDFEVKVGGATMKVATATWEDESAPRDPASASPEESSAAPEPGRTVVIFVQTDFTRNNLRTSRQMQFRRYAEQIVSSFDPEDRIAVFSFDSHLKLRADLSTDREAAMGAMRQALLIDTPPPPPEVPEPSFARVMKREEMKDARNSEEALLLLGRALGRIEGPKTLLLIGWGLGDHMRGVFLTKPAWQPARRALIDSRTTVIAVDTGFGGQLGMGLELAATQTGGFRVRAADLPQIVVNRVQKAMRGRYELELIATTPIAAGIYDIDVRVLRPGAVVLAPDSIRISEDAN